MSSAARTQPSAFHFFVLLSIFFFDFVVVLLFSAVCTTSDVRYSCLYVSVCLYMLVCLFVCICLFVCLSACLSVCMCRRCQALQQPVHGAVLQQCMSALDAGVSLSALSVTGYNMDDEGCAALAEALVAGLTAPYVHTDTQIYTHTYRTVCCAC